MVKRCFVPNCKTGRKSDRNNELKFSLFKAPNDLDLLQKWRDSVPRRERELSSKDCICEKHFEQHFVIPRWKQSKFGDFYEDHIRPKLTRDAVPTIFPDVNPNVSNTSLVKVATPHKDGSKSFSKDVCNMKLPEVEVNENDIVPICYKCLIKKCSAHIQLIKE